ncbi:ABC transporter substrate-binding protein [Methanococcus maripaludis]|uniref:Iron complex transport system substrate-binding protein n=1 Tax=Methanococcus maripaludis TaxID=39152 RepID=A0A7J9PWQ1_METMI|nr:ABC transporter substrate-binding protein [Methanococcus maripaludis]MBA2869240.1 iron complex transport system substrate-binding protein [Methanococcus maripaludis]
MRTYLVLFSILLVFLAGCISTESKVGDTTTAVNMVSVTDFTGETSTINSPVERVVSNYGLIPPIIYLFGEGDKIVAGRGVMGADEFIDAVDPEFKTRSKDIKSDNVEEIKSLNPDVIFAPSWGSQQGQYPQVKGLGIPVVFIDIETASNYYKTLEMMGEVFQKEAYAQELIDYYNQSTNDVLKRTASISENEKPRVLFLVYDQKKNSYWTPGGEFYQNNLITMAGGKTVSSNLPTGKAQINVEQAASWNPDVIITSAHTMEYPSTKVKEDVLNDDGWKEINAVKSGNVYAMPFDGESWDTLGPKYVLGLYWTAKTLHPDMYADVDILNLTSSEYERFFNVSIDEVTLVGDNIE